MGRKRRTNNSTKLGRSVSRSPKKTMLSPVVKMIEEDEDPVESEIDVIMLPVTTRQQTTTSINRLQFAQSPYWLRNQLMKETQECDAKYKTNVNHLQIGFPSNRTKDLLNETSSGSSSFNSNNSSTDAFIGEGFSNPSFVNNAIGFFQNRKLFLLPVNKTYEMRRKLTSKNDEAYLLSQKEKSEKQAASSNNKTPTPLRVRFARPESDLQRRRREQSSYYKQKLVDQDPWISLKIGSTKIEDLYANEVRDAEMLTATTSQINHNNTNFGLNSNNIPVTTKTSPE